MSTSSVILLIEDDADYANLIRRLLRDTDFDDVLVHHEALNSALAYLQGTDAVNVILLDLNLPDSNDREATFHRVQQQAVNVPIVVLTGLEESNLARQLVKSGAQDYLSKSHINTPNLVRAINHARERHEKLVQLRQQATAATAAEQRLNKMIHASSDGILVLDTEGRIRFANPAMRVMLGRTDPDSLIGMEFGYPIDTGKPTEINIRRPDGSQAIAEMRLVEIDWEEDAGYLATFRDVTERKENAAALSRINKRFRSLIYSSPDTHLGITYPEQGLTLYRDDFLDYTRAEIEDGETFFNAAHPDDRPVMLQHLADILATQPDEVVTTEYRVYRKGRQQMEWVQARGIVSNRGEDASPREILVNLSIVTAAKQAEQRLRQSEARFRLMADDAPVMIWMTHVDGEDDYFNRAWLELTGRTLTQEKDDGWLVGVHPEDRNDVQAAYEKARSQQTLFDTEFRLRRADGDYAWVMSHGVPLTGPDGAFSGFIGSAVDITRRKAADEKALELAIQQRQIEVTQQFIEAATHEFRTPLSIINSNVYLTQRVQDTTRQRRYLEVIHEQVGAISSLIDDLVTMLNLDGLHDMPIERLHINEFIGTALTQYMPLATAKGITLSSELNDDLPYTYGSRRYLGIAVQRLLDNAIRYTSTGGRVTVRSLMQDEHLLIEVADTGIGMTPDELAQAFDAFYRRDSAHSTRGFGLGLSIADRAVTLHSGAISATSKAGEGSTFIVKLPVRTQGEASG